MEGTRLTHFEYLHKKKAFQVLQLGELQFGVAKHRRMNRASILSQK